MNIDINTFLIVCPIVGLAGFVDSIAGGGGLISLPGYLIAGLSPITAFATNKVSAGMGTTVAFGNYIKNKFVNFRLAIPCMIISLISSWFGAKVQMMIPENYLKIFMLVALPVTLLIILNKESLRSFKLFNTKLTPKVYALAFLISIVIGFYDGVYGPATGTFLLIFFVKVVKMNMHEANGLTKAINWATNMGALATFLTSGKAIISLGIAAGVCNMLGSYFGSKMFIKKGADIARPIMIIVMIIFIIKIVTELLY